MTEPMQDTTTDNTPRRAFGWCAWHQGHAEDVRLIQVYEQGSGPGGSLFACPPCQESHALVPFADQP